MQVAQIIKPTPQPQGITTEAWQHQCRAIEFAKNKDASLFAHAMGSGKSLSAVSLLNTWDAKRVIIVCPVSVIGVWPSEFKIHSSERWRIVPLTFGTAADKAYQVGKELSISSAKNERLAFVINYESIWRPKLAQLLIHLAKRGIWDALVCDEIHRAKSARGKSSRWLATFAKHIPKKLGLTGTPMPHSPLDIYAQFRILDPNIFGYSNASFKAQYAVLGGYNMMQTVDFKNQDQLANKMNLITHKISKEEALPDLPPQLFIRRECALEPKAFHAYKDLEKQMIAMIEDEVITASNGLVKLLRLQQITSGYLELPEKGLQQVSEAKLKLMEDLAEDIEPPFVVFCRFKNDLMQVRKMAEKMGLKYGEVSGAQKDLTENAKMPEWVDILGVQIQAGGVGIDLSRACTALWYSIGFSLGDYEQACARLHRPGQFHTVRHIHLIATETIDEVVFAALGKKQDIVKQVIKRLKG
jgi:SNF2 family DNA or RNA helicase